MKYKLRAIIFLISVGLLYGCAEDTADQFIAFVHPDISIAQDVLVDRVGCMHCPTYFRFKMSASHQAMLLDYQGLERIDVPTDHMEQVSSLPDAKWWPPKTEIPKMDRYWVEYASQAATDLPRFRMALIQGETVYYMAAGGNWILEKNQ